MRADWAFYGRQMELRQLQDSVQAPLFNRTTDKLELGHLDIGSVLEILRAHADEGPERLLFLWSLFEGVPKFYRDAYEQDALDADRETVLRKLFFSSSSPLRNEADNWFLRELRGRYDMALQFLASHPGCNNAAIEAHLAEVSGPGEARQVGGHLKILTERYRMIERRLPIFARPKARSGRYYIRDNFLRARLSALQKPVSASAFRPLETMVAQADKRLKDVNGYALKDLAAQLYEERSRLGLGDFALSERIRGYWDRSDVEIDLVAVSEQQQTIRFGSRKRQAEKLPRSIPDLAGAAERFLAAHKLYQGWNVEYVAIAPGITELQALDIRRQGAAIPQSLAELCGEL